MKTEAPSEDKLHALRSQGIVPVSNLAHHAVGAAAALIAITRALTTFDHTALTSCATVACPQLLPVLKEALFSLILLPTLTYAVAAFTTALAQTRGLILLRIIRPTWPTQKNTPLIAILLGWLAAILGAVALLVTLPKQLAQFTSAASAESWGTIHAMLTRSLSYTAAGLGIIGLLGWVFARLLFFREHRMTREEIAREQRS